MTYWHDPLTHPRPEGHSVPQVPQLLLSLVRSEHVPAQFDVPFGQVHWLFSQTRLPPQASKQSPQLALFEVRSTQAPPHCERPLAAHLTAHVPALQMGAVAGQALPQASAVRVVRRSIHAGDHAPAADRAPDVSGRASAGSVDARAAGRADGAAGAAVAVVVQNVDADVAAHRLAGAPCCSLRRKRPRCTSGRPDTRCRIRRSCAGRSACPSTWCRKARRWPHKRTGWPRSWRRRDTACCRRRSCRDRS
jgi:hypothetical protein